jgi:multiple sugar transport system ATP-binding protein
LARVFYDDVSKRFGSLTALSDLTLEIQDGEFFVLLGPSGCGKTTALRIAAGLEELTEGSVYIGDRRVNDVPAKDRDIAMVFQNYALYPHMTVYANIAFGLRMRKQSKGEIDRLVRDTAAALDIAAMLDRRPGQLSGGQQQRVALGRAIVRRPQAFLMDEPLSNLDSKMRVQMRAELVRLHRDLAATFIYVTHDQVEAMTMAQRLAVLDAGLLQQVGTPQDVYERPANLFVASFIGTPAMNLLDAGPARENGVFGLRAGYAFVSLPQALATTLEGSGSPRFVIGLRPEALSPAADSAAATFEGTIDVIERLGNEQHVLVTLREGTVTARLPSSLRLEAGSQIRLTADAGSLHVFDAATKERIGP